jgi:hypothetical protein
VAKNSSAKSALEPGKRQRDILLDGVRQHGVERHGAILRVIKPGTAHGGQPAARKSLESPYDQH